MGDIEHHRRSREVVTELISLAQEVSSLAQECETEGQVFNEFSILMDKFVPILSGLRENYKIMEHPPVQKAIESLGKEFSQAKGLVANPGSKTLVKQLENLVHELGRSIGLLLFASLELCVDLKDKIGALHRDLMGSRLDPSSVASSSRHSEIVSEFDVEEQVQEGEIRKEKIGLDVDDVVLKLKYGNEEEIKLAVLGLSELIEEKRVESDWVENEGVIPALFSRLGSSKSEYRLIMIHLLRTLALDNPKNKEKMAEVGFLSTLVRSLAREEEERREAVGLLLGLSELSTVRRRIGRIQGCIVMLVALLNGDDLIASRDAGKLLNCLSSNTQNALHMAEAGYFKPIVQYLKEGSDMSKILMATALSRMELTDQNKASLGEDGAIKPLARMFATGKLEAKASALNVLQNLSGPPENARRLAQSGILPPLLQLLSSVTSALTALRGPASAVLAQIAGSEAVVINPGIAQQMLSLLSLSSPTVRAHLLRALNSISVNPNALKFRRKMKESCAVRLILPFLRETNYEVRESALALLHTLCQDLSEQLSEQIGQADISTLVGLVSSSKSDSEKADSLGILSCFLASDKRVAEIFKRERLLPAIISTLSRVKTDVARLEEGAAGVLIRLTTPSDRKLQLYAVENGAVPLLVRLLSSESVPAKSRAATSLGQLSRNSIPTEAAAPGWFCGVPALASASCEVHGKNCSAKGSFCLVKAGAVAGLLRILEGRDRGADEAALGALATLLRDEIWERGSYFAAKTPGFFQAVLRALGPGTATGAREKALWILERVFRVEGHRVKYGKSAQAVLIDLAHHGDSRLKPMIVKVLARLEVLQLQSSYF